MIISYRCKDSKAFAEGMFVEDFAEVEQQARTRLSRLNAATSLNDLAMLRGNRLERLHGDREGQYSIRINNKWRICFEWPKMVSGPINVEIVDYHN